MGDPTGGIGPLDPESWERIAPIFDAALEAEPGQRDELLREACAGDAELRRAVERLLRAAEQPTNSLDRPAAEVAAGLLTGESGGGASGETAPSARRPSYRAGDILAGYRIENLIGRGGMGEVFRAHHATLDRDVALKVLPAHLTGSAEARRRLINEARAASRLDHPNVQTVFDAGETDEGGVYLALALYDGPTLAARLTDEGPLALDEVVSVALQLAEGLAAAHAHGIVHRDVKPSNLIVSPGGRLKILDFGIARLADRPVTRDGSVYGTVAYMSPEQTRGEPAAPPGDVWAFGVVLYEMLAGRRPFRGDNDRALIHAIRHDEPASIAEVCPDAPAWLAEIVEHCLRKEEARRPADMALLADELAVATGERSRAGHGRAAPRSRRRAIAGAALGGVALAVAAAIGVTYDWGGGAGHAEGAVRPVAATMTVLPFIPVAGDSAGVKLGRQLAVTVSTNLNGVGSIRTPEGLAVLTAIGTDGKAATGDAEAAALARRFSTGSYLRGTLIEVGPNIRVDAALHEAAGGEEIGRIAATAAADDIAALTDSVTLAVLRAVWRRGAVPAPSIVALTTPSVPAFRAYLEGELHLAAGRFGPAIAAFDSAFRVDSTFWYARWRSVYPRAYEPSADLGVEAWKELYEHRDALPAPDRLLAETYRIRGAGELLAALRDITNRYPTYWPGWWSYANFLVHRGFFLGRQPDEVRRALEQTLELQPQFVPAWEHLLWMTHRQRDAVRTGQALAALERAGRGDNPRLNRDVLPTYRILKAALEEPDLSTTNLGQKVDHVLAYSGPLPPMFFALDVLLFGECAAQRELNRALLARELRPGPEDIYRFFLGLAVACTGDWSSGVAEVGARPGSSVAEISPLAAYGFAVVGAWLGEIAPAGAAALRPDTSLTADADAERLWLDGLLAVAQDRPDALEDFHSRLVRHEAPHAPRLGRSLAAFRLALAGDTAAAGPELAELEEEASESGAIDWYGAPHPWLTGVNRLAAARWLAIAGDTARALDLLGWDDAVLPERYLLMGPAGQVLRPRASLLRGRLYAAHGDSVRAAFHYETVRRQYDRPAEAVAGAVAEAKSFEARR